MRGVPVRFFLGLLLTVRAGQCAQDCHTGQDPQGVTCEPEIPDPWIDENYLNEIHLEGQSYEPDTKLFGLSHDPEDVKFLLYYTPNHPMRYDRLYVNEERSIMHARFKKGAPLIFIAHGFLATAFMPNSTVQVIKNALLSMSIVNVIGIDWSKLSSSESPVAFLSYAEVTQNVPVVGRKVADMIEFLIELEIISGPQDVHLIGHSLGAHVMGVAGHEIHNRTGILIDHITGLDPAGPLFQFINAENKLNPSDAAYVDVLHTAVGMFGSSEILGTADFYANGGKGYAQPGCLNFTNSNPGAFISGVSGICSHSRAYRIYARTIMMSQPELYGCRCRILDPTGILPTSCTLQETALCPDRVLYGFYGPKTAKGSYYVETREAFDVPFFVSLPSSFDSIV